MRVPPPPDRQRLADALRTRRAELRLTQTDVARAAQVSLATVNLMERTGRDNYQTVTKAVVETAVGWEPGSIDALLAGGEATVRDEPPPSPPPQLTLHQGFEAPTALPPALASVVTAMPPATRDLWERLAARIAEELAAGQQPVGAGERAVAVTTDFGEAHGVSLGEVDSADVQLEQVVDQLRDLLSASKKGTSTAHGT